MDYVIVSKSAGHFFPNSLHSFTNCIHREKKYKGHKMRRSLY